MKFVPRSIKVAGYTADGPVGETSAASSAGEHGSGEQGANGARRAA
jgi:hypothetical protein